MLNTKFDPRLHGIQNVLTTLDGFRGVAALAVAARHVPGIWTSGSPSGVLFESYLAVDLFFVLSGFVLTHAYADGLRARMSMGQFALLRLIRIYPLYLMAIGIFVFIELAHKVYNGETPVISQEIFLAMLMVPNTSQPDQFLFPLNPPAWSLLLELLVSLCFGASRSLRTPAYLVPLVVVAAAGLVAAAVWQPAGVPRHGALDVGFFWGDAHTGLLRVGFGFFAGVLLRTCWPLLPDVPRVPAWLLLATLAVVLAACPPASLQPAFDLVAVLLLFPALVYLGAGNEPGRRLRRAMAWAGAVSYPVYVLQVPLYRLTGSVLIKTGLSGWLHTPALLGCAHLAVVLAVSALAVRLYDAPVRRLLRQGLVQARVA